MIDKLSSECDLNCKRKKQESLEIIDEIEEEVKQEEASWNKQSNNAIKHLEKVDKVLEEIEKKAVAFNGATFDSEDHKISLVASIDSAKEAGYLNDDQHKLMKQQVENAVDFDPTVAPTIKEIRSSTKQELHTRRRIALNKEGKWTLIKGELKAWAMGITSMSKTEGVAKSAAAAGHVLSAIAKFKAKKDDGSPDTLEIVSGIADIANGIAEFLPPPASVVTETVSSILNIFGAGSPSTEEIIKEEFQKMKQFTAELFNKQNKFLHSKFEEQSDLIREQTGKIISEMSWEMDQHTENILAQINQQTGEIESFFDDLINFYKNGKMKEVLDSSKELHTKLNEDLDFLEPLKLEKITKDTAEHLDNRIQRISEDTIKFERIKNDFENICLNTKLMQLPIYTMNENRMCTNILYNFLAINMKRETIFSDLITKLYQSIEKRQVISGYLNIASERKKRIKMWLQSKITSNLPLVCPLFVTDIGNWDSYIYKQITKNFIKKVDQSLADEIDLLTIEKCKDEVQKSVLEHCGCNERKSASIYCDVSTKRKCKCKEQFKGDKCQDKQSKCIEKFVSTLGQAPPFAWNLNS